MARKDSKGRNLKEGESQRKDGSFMYRWTDSFGKRRCIYAPDLNSLRQKEKEILKTTLCGGNYEGGTMTVGEYLRQYLDHKKDIRESTSIVYDSTAKRIAGKPIEKMRLSEVKYIHAQHFLESLQENDGLSFNTIAKTKNFFRTIFAEAVKNDFCLKNPFDCTLSGITKDTKKKEAISPEKFEKYLAFAREYAKQPMLPDIVQLLYHSGLRISECVGLTAKDIDLKRRTLSINKQLVRGRNGVHITEPKTESANRCVPLDDVAFEICRKYMKQPRKITPCIDGVTGFLFVTRNGNVESKNTVEDFMLRVKQKWDEKNLGNAMKNFTPHVLRHSFCTNLINQGANLKAVQNIMGHSSVSVTLDIYSHKENESAVTELREFFG